MKNLLIENKNDFIISDWLSPDERYCIFLDELYDIKNKKKLGNIWENFENYKFFLRYSTSVSDLSKTIKESIYDSLNNTIITESFNDTLKKNKKLLSEEGLFGKFVDWASEQGKSTAEGFKEFSSKIYKGSEDLINKIANSEIKQAFDLLSKGILYFAKKLKEALYSPVGMIVDAILVTSGIGKSVQWIPWAIVVGLDIYQLTTNTYEGSLFWHLFEMLFDIIALMTTGALAKGLKITFKGVSKIDDVVKVMSKNPQAKKYMQKIPEYLKKISPKLKEAIQFLSNRFPKGANFIKQILGKVDNVINMITKEFGKLFTKKVAATGAIGTGIGFGIDQIGSDSGGEMSDETVQDAIDLFADSEMDLDGYAF